MADKKLNAVSTLTDFDYALVVKGNDVAKVSKEQLASIVGGLMSNLGLFPFMNRGTIRHGEDLNNIVTPGMYEINASEGEIYNNPSIVYGILVVFVASQRIQIIASGLYKTVYIRSGRDNGTWYEWGKLQ